MRPGDLGMYDPAFVARHAPWLRRLLHGWFRARVEGLERLPPGPFVAAGNHSGGVMIPDTLVWLSAYHCAGRDTPLLTLSHDAMFSSYPERLATSLAKLGAMRADRAQALEALATGHAVQVYPGGDHDACRPVWQRNRIVFAGRTGYAELACRAGVPVVPVVSIGGHETLLVLWSGASLARRLGSLRRRRVTTLPLTLSVPWGPWLGPTPGHLPLPSRIEIRVLDPISTTGRAPAEIDVRVRASLQHALTELARRRTPLWG